VPLRVPYSAFALNAYPIDRLPAPVAPSVNVIHGDSEWAFQLQPACATIERLSEPLEFGRVNDDCDSGSTHVPTVNVWDAPPAGPRGTIALITAVPSSCAVSVAVSAFDGATANALGFEEVQLATAPLTGCED